MQGTAYVVYEDIYDAKNACDHLSGFNVCNRYLIVLYYQARHALRHEAGSLARTGWSWAARRHAESHSMSACCLCFAPRSRPRCRSGWT